MAQEEALSGSIVPLTEEQQKLTEEWFHLAAACAKLKMRKGLDFDILYSQACEGLVLAARKWDNRFGDPDGFGPFAVQQINWWLLRLWKPRCPDQLQIKPCGVPMPEFAEKNIAAKEENDKSEIKAEMIKHLKCLKPIEKSVLIMTEGYEVSQKDVADRLKVSAQYVSSVIVIAKQKLAKSIKNGRNYHRLKQWVQSSRIERTHQLMTWRKKYPKKFAYFTDLGNRHSAESRRRSSILSLVQGRVFSKSWYAVDVEAKTVTGPYHSRGEAEGRQVKRGVGGGGSAFGWPGVRTAQAKILNYLADQESASCSEVATVVLARPKKVKDALMNLRKTKMVELIGPSKGRNCRWRITSKGLSSRKKPLLVFMGMGCKKYLDEGYTPLPARHIEKSR